MGTEPREGAGPFRDDSRAIRVARATQRDVEHEARAARRRPWWAFGAAFVAIAITGGALVLFFFLLRTC